MKTITPQICIDRLTSRGYYLETATNLVLGTDSSGETHFDSVLSMYAKYGCTASTLCDALSSIDK